MNSFNDGGTTLYDYHDKHEKDTEKLFACEKCCETFENDYELKEHLNTIYMCNICHRIFNSSRNFMKLKHLCLVVKCKI